jgi:2'-5' RNA ligase
MPRGVVSLLDDDFNGHIEILWQKLEDRFGKETIQRTPYPHFSYHVADSYAEEQVSTALTDLINEMRPFTVRTAGLGMFTGDAPVLYIAMVRDPQLSELQKRIYDITEPHASDTFAYYHPQKWVPHITLLRGGLDSGSVSRVIEMLREENFHREIHIDKLALLDETYQPERSYTLRETFLLSRNRQTNDDAES